MNSQHEIAVFGGGCFWCTEAVFKMLKGVESVEPGYAGGTTHDPSYEAVSSGNTGHAEVVKIIYDPILVSFTDLLTVFFNTHDPTALNRQGNDVGTQYRSVIFYTSPQQKEEAGRFIADLQANHAYPHTIVTEVAPLTAFYPAEDYHRDYFQRNPEKAYCQIVIAPKVEKVQARFKELLRKS